MSNFIRKVAIDGKYKDVIVSEEGKFFDWETGEEIDLAAQLFQVYGDNPFTISTTMKRDYKID